MKYKVIIAKSAECEFRQLNARWRSAVKRAMHKHLEHQPKCESKSRIKRLRLLRQPQYRLRIEDVRIFYDIDDKLNRVDVLGFVLKSEANNWLDQYGVSE